MTALTNSAEGVVPSGTTVTTANSGGASGSHFDAVSGTAPVSSSAQAAHGSLSYEVTTSGASYVAWTTSMGTLTQAWFREYLFLSAAPAANVRTAIFQTATTLCGTVIIGTSGKAWFADSTGSAVAGMTTPSPVPTNAWFRAEGFIIGSATVGQVELKIWDSLDSTGTPDFSATSAATLNTTGPLSVYRFGGAATTPSVSYWLDDLGLSSVGYLGPALYSQGAVTATGAGSLVAWNHGQVSDSPAGAEGMRVMVGDGFYGESLWPYYPGGPG